jgi:hypothetical protein
MQKGPSSFVNRPLPNGPKAKMRANGRSRCRIGRRTMKKVRETQEAGSAPNAEGSERQEDGPLREPEVTLAKEEGRWQTAKVRRRTTGGRASDKGDVETRARERPASTRRGMQDAIDPIRRPEGRLALEDGAQQDERVTLPNGDVRAPIASRRFACAKGRTQDAGSRPESDESPPLYAKSSAVARFPPARSAKRSAWGGRVVYPYEQMDSAARWFDDIQLDWRIKRKVGRENAAGLLRLKLAPSSRASVEGSAS